jgi:hypothetical protein
VTTPRDTVRAATSSDAISRGPRVGFVSGRLTVVQVLENRPRRSGTGVERWILVECSCPAHTRKELRWTAVCSGNTRSCGCLAAESRKTRNLRHGESGTPLYQAWSNMKQRCSNTKIRAAHRYSGQGIKVCPEWINSFENFRDWARGHGYVEGKELDRIDNSHGYSPDNCRWVTKLENLDNRAKYLPADLEKWLQERAQQQGCTPYEIIKQALEEYLGVQRTGASQDDANRSDIT